MTVTAARVVLICCILVMEIVFMVVPFMMESDSKVNWNGLAGRLVYDADTSVLTFPVTDQNLTGLIDGRCDVSHSRFCQYCVVA
jgi:hypothetical protein